MEQRDRIKVSDLTAGPQLDALVAMAQGWHKTIVSDVSGSVVDRMWTDGDHHVKAFQNEYQPSTNGAQAFELIEKFGITVGPSEIAPNTMWTASLAVYAAGIYVDNYLCTDSTPAEAICKAVVASKWGDEIPDDVWEQVK